VCAQAHALAHFSLALNTVQGNTEEAPNAEELAATSQQRVVTRAPCAALVGRWHSTGEGGSAGSSARRLGPQSP